MTKGAGAVELPSGVFCDDLRRVTDANFNLTLVLNVQSMFLGIGSVFSYFECNDTQYRMQMLEQAALSIDALPSTCCWSLSIACLPPAAQACI